MVSIYVHIPFCKSICSYCDFPKILHNSTVVEKYLNELDYEISDTYFGEKVETLYIGGGTPSSLTPVELIKLKDIIKKFDMSEIKEFTFECNIEDVKEEFLIFLKKIGVNRLSIGVESFVPCKLNFMNRKCTFEEVKEKILLAREIGFNNINLDLIYGVPGENFLDLKSDVKKLLSLEPEHISTYSLIIEPHTLCKIRGDENINPDVEVKMYEYITRKLEQNSYTHYEISNFSKPGFESKHNLKYWNNEEYYGFGLGASGYIKGFRYDNTRSMSKYLERNYKESENLLGKRETMENEVMLGLRKMEGINLQRFYDKFEVNIQDVFPVKPLLRSRELIYKNGHIFVNPKYIYVMNEILLKLI